MYTTLQRDSFYAEAGGGGAHGDSSPRKEAGFHMSPRHTTILKPPQIKLAHKRSTNSRN